jgi:hypothetical protein
MTIDLQLAALNILGDEEIVLEKADVLDEFLQAAAVAGAIGGPPGTGFAHVEAFTQETAERNADVAARYRKIANEAAKKDPAGGGNSLAKRAGKTIEETVYPSGATVIAELENGVVVKTYVKGESA